MPATPVKPRRITLLLPFFLLALAAGGWSIFWFVARDRIEQGFDEQAKALRAQGYELDWKERRIGGFPFRFSVNLTEAVIAEPGGWGVSAPRLGVETTAYSPQVIVFVAPDGVVLKRPDGRAFAIKARVLRASLGGYRKTPPRISIEGADMAIASTGGGTALLPTIKRFEAHVRPVAGDKAAVTISAEDAGVAPETVLGRIAGTNTMSVRIAGEASHASALHGSGWPGVIRSWSAAGGGFDVREGGLRAGEVMLTLKPARIAADAEGRVEGSLSVSMSRAKEGVLSLGAIGAIPVEAAAVASGLAGITEISRPTLDLTLGFRDGRTHLGPLPVGPAPRFY